MLAEEQVRLWWDGSPTRVLAAVDRAVFKVLFDRPKDWVDIATMLDSATLDVAEAARQVETLFGDDPRVGRPRSM